MSTDITPIINLFQEFASNLPDGFWKFIVLLFLVYGLGALIAFNSSSKDNTSPLFWVDFSDDSDINGDS
jgi:hypothetical protein